MIYSYACDFATFVLCFLIDIICKFTYLEKGNRSTYFRFSIKLLLLATISNLSFNFILNESYNVSKYIAALYLLRTFFIVSLMTILTLFVLYLFNLVEKENKRIRLKKYLHYYLIFFVGIESVCAIFSYINDKTLYDIKESILFIPFAIHYSTLIILLAIFLIKNNKEFSKKILKCIFCMEVLSIGIVEFSLFSNIYTFISFSYIIPVVCIMFLVHNNCYNVNTGTLDIEVFTSFIADKIAERKNCNIIVLKLIDFNVEHNRAKRNMEEIIPFRNELCRLFERKYSNAFLFKLDEWTIAFVQTKTNEHYIKESIDFVYNLLDENKNKYNLTFKIISIGVPSILDNIHHFNRFTKFMHKKVKNDDICIVSKQDYIEYLRLDYIRSQLEDIYKQKNLDDNRVLVYCQPIISTESGNAIKAEALVRLNLPKQGLVYPNDFISIAEEYGYIHILDKIVFAKTCSEIRKLLDEGYEFDRFTINFSTQELTNEYFVNELYSICKHYNIPKDKIGIEITESTNDATFNELSMIAKQLKINDVKICLDDFGTGYTNLERILSVPFDIIKFDRSLVLSSLENEKSFYLTSHLAATLKKLGYQILFEGIEDEEAENACISMQADFLQGYKYSKPIPISEIRKFFIKR